MKASQVINKIIEKENIGWSKMARALGISVQNLNNRIKRCKSDLTAQALIQMANYLDYDLVLLPKSKNGGGGIIIDGKDEK